MHKRRHIATVTPPREFWEAVLHIHNRYFEPNLLEYTALPQSERSGHVFRSLQIQDIWLDVALSSGVLDQQDD